MSSSPEGRRCLPVSPRLMTYGLALAARGVRHHPTGELFASLSKDEHAVGTANIHAGAALLATGGVCLLGDLSLYKRDKLDALQSGSQAHQSAPVSGVSCAKAG